MRILVVEDDPGVSALLRRTLRFEGYETEHVENGIVALDSIIENDPDLVILDLMIPGINGIEVARRLRMSEHARNVETPVPILMLTARDAVADRVNGLDAGADDYLVKPFSLDELLARVRAMQRRHSQRRQAAAAEEIIVDNLRVIPPARQAFRGNRELQLTPKEFDLLLYFSRHPNIVLTRGQIMDRFWESGDSADANILEVYVGNLRRELERQQEPRMLQTVRGVGYALRTTRQP